MRFLCRGLLVALALAGNASADQIELARDADYTLYGLTGRTYTGYKLAGGDFDGDGTDDLAISAQGSRVGGPAGPLAGVVYLLFGGPDILERLTTGLEAVPNTIVGTRDGQSVGRDIVAGDFNGDGYSDLLLGVPLTTEGNDPGIPMAGGAYLVLGRKRDEFPPSIALPGDADALFVPPAEDVRLGEAVAMGDFDGDGRDDIAIGAMYGNGPDGLRPHAGTTFLYRGRKKPRKIVEFPKHADMIIHGSERQDTSGRSLEFVDWDGDGREDLLVGAYYGDGPMNDRHDPGEAHLIAGRKKFKPKMIDLNAGGSMPIYGFWELGALARYSSVGDLDGDGLGDLVLPSYRAPLTGERSRCGVVDVIFGRKEGAAPIDLDSHRELRLFGGYYADFAGRPVKAADLDGDGREDLLIAAGFADPFGDDGVPRLQAGIIGVLMGRPREQFADSLVFSDESLDHLINGVDANDHTPSSMEVLDIDGDGKADLVIGAAETPGRANEMKHAGEVYFLLGRSRSW